MPERKGPQCRDGAKEIRNDCHVVYRSSRPEMRRVRPWKAEREQGHCERVGKLDPECAQESEEAERRQCCQYNGRGEVVARVEPEERVREREKERKDRPAGDAVPPFEDTRSPPPLEVIRGSITPVVVVEASVSHVCCQEE